MVEGTVRGLPRPVTTEGNAVYRYEKEYRWTRLDGIDYYIGLCLKCRKVIEPVGGYRSRSGTHGTDFYEHEHPLRFVFLHSTNSGNRIFAFDEDLEFLYDIVKSVWIYRREQPGDVKDAIAKYLEGVAGSNSQQEK
jgi:hypothetical protein